MKRFAILGLALALGSIAPAVRADTFVLDTSTGAAYDAIGDGWFFAGPSMPPPDGVGDAGGQALAVGYIAGVLELRALSEFPLAPLTGLTASQIQSATFTFTIDDVLSTFGPGATFDNTASSPVAVYHYPANGVVTLSDFAPAGLAPLGIVTPGVVTDASLAISGALSFDVDATDELKAALTAGDTAFGALIGTLDSPTGTSLDNVSPPGVAGGALPILTVVTIPLTPPVLSSAEQACQSTIQKEGSKLVSSALKSFGSCFSAILKDYAPDQVLAAATISKCAGELDVNNAGSKLGKAAVKFGDKVTGKCGSLTPADIGSPCNPAAESIAGTISCLRTAQLAAAESAAASQYGNACTLLSSVNLDTTFPGVCVP
ncbi:MAG TPA: hypothetical protein VGR62_23675 [Candidatus Binatia bacterium]|nr:hypothetical protein [Candidatus Binatia bacterium]